nr:hypothetical protein [Streptomyces sp. TLI_235]
MRVDQVLGASCALPVAEQGTPERHHRGAGEGVDGDLDGLHGRRVGRQLQLAGHRRDLPGQFDVPPGQPVVVLGERDQPHGDALGPQIDVGRVRAEAGQVADLLHEPGTGREGPVRKYAQTPSPSTRQSCRPSLSWKYRGLIFSNPL